MSVRLTDRRPVRRSGGRTDGSGVARAREGAIIYKARLDTTAYA
ncbi:hypothetical protein ABT382_19345 [Streptomyces pharetrae]